MFSDNELEKLRLMILWPKTLKTSICFKGSFLELIFNLFLAGFGYKLKFSKSASELPSEELSLTNVNPFSPDITIFPLSKNGYTFQVPE